MSLESKFHTRRNGSVLHLAVAAVLFNWASAALATDSETLPEVELKMQCVNGCKVVPEVPPDSNLIVDPDHLISLGGLGIPNKPPQLDSERYCNRVQTSCDALPETPETALACDLIGNYEPLIRPACEATIDSANAVVRFLWDQGYVRAGEPQLERICDYNFIQQQPTYDPITGTQVSYPWSGQGYAGCLTLSAQVLYSARSDSAVILCEAYSDGATTVSMDCGGTPGIAVAPTAIAITPAIPGATGSADITVRSTGPLPERVISDKEATLTISW